MKRIIFVLLLALGIISQGASLWADDDAIMDVDNTQYIAIVGSWSVSSWAPCAIGGAYYYAWGSDDSITVQTVQNADISGYYAAYARWTSASNRNNNARYRIYDGNTYRSTQYRNQRSNGCNWQYLYTVYLTAGNRGKVILDNLGATASEVTVADGIRFVRVTKDGSDITPNGSLRDYHIADEPGLDWSGLSERNIATQVTSNCSYLTNLASVTITAPTSGYVYVHANGIADLSTTDRWVRVGIDDASHGSTFDSYAPFLENCSAEVNAGNYEDERRYTVSKVYSVSSGSKTYYLKACKESGATGRIMWDDFVAIFFPTRY